MFTANYDIDVSPGGVVRLIHVSQYDADAREIVFNLISTSGALSLPSGVKAEVRGTKPDGNGFSYGCPISGKLVTMKVTEQMCAVAGTVPCELVIYVGTPPTEAEPASPDFKQLCTATFYLKVKRAAMDKDTLGSNSEIRQLVTVIDRTDVLLDAASRMDEATATIVAKTQEATDAAADSQRSASDAADSLRQVNLQAAESQRVVNETLETVEQKTQDLLQITYDSDYLATQALEKAEAAENESAETSSKLDQVNETMTEIRLLSDAKIDGAFEENGYLYLTSQNEVVVGPLGPFSSNGSGGGGGGSGNNATLTVSNTTGWMAKTIAPGSPCLVSLNWSSVEEDLPTGNGSLRLTVNNVVKLNTGVPQGEVTVDLAPYCNQGANTCKIQITDVYGNSRTINFSITLVVLTISSTFDSSSPFNGAVSFPYTPVGAAVEKSVHFILDGTEFGTQSTSVSGRQVSFTIPAQPHGAHSLRVYFEATVNGETVRSNELYYEFISLEQLNRSVIIVSSFNTGSVDQYNSVLIPYRVYNPVADRTEVRLYLNGSLVSTQTVDRTEQSFTFRADNAGQTEFRIEAGTASKTFSIEVIESAIQVEAETEDLALYLNAQGRSNNEATRTVWQYEDIAAELSNFGWRLDGWQKDGDGIDVLRLVGDARVVIPYQIFAADFKATGKTIEIEFATRSVSDYTALLLSCFADDIGLKITPQNIVFKGAQNEISTLFKDNEHIRLSIVVEKQNENRLILVYINGIMSRAIQYASGERFSQLSPVGITIGSNDCGIDIYNIRVYDNSLSRKQILDNWIADTQVGDVMLNRYMHNNVYDEYGNITIANLPTDLPYMILEAEELPQYKGDKKTISGSFTVPGYATRSFTFEGCQINVQGTSSAIYYRKNYDLQFKEGFITPSGTIENYALKPGSIPFNRFVIKADVASSESTNNTGLTSFYSDTCPYKTPEQLENPKVRQGIEGIPIVVFWYNPDTQKTSFLGKFNFNLPKRAPEPLGFSGNMESWEWERNNSANVKFQDNDFVSQSWDEVKQEYYPTWYDDFEARFPSDEWRDYSKLNEFLAWVKSTWRDAATGEDLPEPIVYRLNSTITVNDYAEDLSFSVVDETDNGVSTGYKIFTFTKDTPAYRLTKFKAECPDYVELESAVYYYLFTETFLMIDSRAKNMFPSFNGGPVTQEGRVMDRKVVFMPYDMDTALGTNNSGVLMFGYYLEDTDHVSSVISGDGSGSSNAPVFNAQDSVFWTNLRDSFRAEITAMYRNLRANRTWSYSALEGIYEEHQAKWPEAIFNEDAYEKYIVPLVDPVTVDENTGELIRTDRYLTMLQGSKAEQRKWWLFNRFRYMDSKYVTGDASANVINIRFFNSGRLTLTPAIDLYVGVSFGGGTTVALKRTTANNPVSFDYVSESGVTEMETWIYSADMIRDVGDLSVFYPNECDFSKATRLKNLKIGDTSEGYSNANLVTLDVRNSALLEKIDVRNCPRLAITVNLENSPRLKEAYFDGTAITGVDLVDGGAVEILHLPETVTTLTLLNLNKLSEFVIPSYANISRVMLANIDTEIIDPITLLESIRANSQVNIQGLNLELDSLEEINEVYDLFDTMSGVTRDKSSGGEWIYHDHEKAQISGTIRVPAITTDQIRELALRYPNIAVTADEITYTVNFYNVDTLVYTAHVVGGQDCTDPVTARLIDMPFREAQGNTAYSYTGWDCDLTNVQSDLEVHAVFAESNAYTVTFVNWDGTVLFTRLVGEGATCPDPVATGEIDTPTRPADSSYVYSYLGWIGGSLANVRQDRTLTARYSQQQSYAITFTDYDNTVLGRLHLGLNAAVPDPVRIGLFEEPSRPDDTANQYTYTFNGWNGQNSDGSFPTVSQNRTYQAKYNSQRYYYAIFTDWDDTELFREQYFANDRVTDPLLDGRQPVPTREPEEYNYTFWKWNTTFPRTISANFTAKAQYKTDQVFTVTFVDYDRATLLDVQHISDTDSAVDPVTSGRISTPLREPTAQYEYTFSGWSGTYTTVREDKTIVATYTSTTRSYVVNFYDGERLMKTMTVLYSNSASYGEWPVREEVEGSWYLDTWQPEPSNVRAPMDCYAQWIECLTDSWQDIIDASHDGTYRQKYSIGDVKLLDLGVSGPLAMQLVGFDTDVKPDGTNAPMTWIAINPTKTSDYYGRTAFEAKAATHRFTQYSDSQGIYWKSRNYNVNRGVAVSEFHITADQDTDVLVKATCSSQFAKDLMSVWVDDVLMADGIGNYPAEEKTQTYHLLAGEELVVFAQYVKDQYTNAGSDSATIRFISDNELSVTLTEPENSRAVLGMQDGFEYTNFRKWISETLFARLPQELQQNIVEVKKYTLLKSGTEGLTVERLWPMSLKEFGSTLSGSLEPSGLRYAGLPTGTPHSIRKYGLQYACAMRYQNDTSIIRSSNSYGTSAANPAENHCAVLGFCL